MTRKSQTHPLFARLLESAQDFHVQHFERSWLVADRIERKARLEAVMELSIELAKIRAIEIFATGIGEGAIATIIDGDWALVRQYADDFTFADEGEEIARRYAPLWERFRDLLHAAAASAALRAAGHKKS